MLYLPLVIIKVPEAEAYNQVMSEPLDFSCKTLHNFLSFNLAKLSPHTGTGTDLPLILVFLSTTTVYEQVIRARIRLS